MSHVLRYSNQYVAGSPDGPCDPRAPQSLWRLGVGAGYMGVPLRSSALRPPLGRFDDPPESYPLP